MSVTLTFLPWARVGVGRMLTPQPGALRAQVSVEAQVGGRIGAVSAPPVPAPQLLAEVLGPGDVMAIDPRIIIRAEPGPYAQEAPARALVSIEFSRPDFPWMFSPLVPDSKQRLSPWICLLVVPQRPGISLLPRNDARLPVLTVDTASELPDLAEAWAWAHVQVLSDETHPPASTIGANDQRSLSRLISPRRLEPATSYYACLVPTFNVGREVGLDPTAVPSPPIAPAWTGAVPAGFQLPVYHWWTFSTGPAGDFQDLVVKLRAQELPRELGWRPITIDFPSPTPPPGFHAFRAPLEGVLRGVHDPPAVSDLNAAKAVNKELRRIIGLQRTVVPPRYGQAQAPAGAPWMEALNGAPTTRIAAAVGARVVQAQQEQLMASAWEQVGEMQRANQQRRHAEVAVVVAEALMRRHLGVMTTDRVLQLSAPTRVPTSGGALAPAALAGVPAATLTGTFRRLQRRGGSLARRAAVIPAGPRLVNMALPRSATLPSTMGMINQARLALLSPDLIFQAKPAVLLFSEVGLPKGWTSAVATFRFSGTMVQPPHTVMTRNIQGPGASVPWRLDDATQFDAETKDPAALAKRRETATNFQKAAVIVQKYLFEKVLPRARAAIAFQMPAVEESGAAAVRAAVLDALRPARTLVARVAAATGRRRSTSATGNRPSSESPGPSGLAALRHDPVFPQGMYRALADLAPDMFLIGVDRIPDNSIGLVRVNAPFIESYLVGLNHEMGRELLWRGFPSDGRGTYFRRFWDTDAYPALSAWRARLGANAPMRNWVVLVIRGELVRHYPRAVVFAQRGKLDSSGKRFVPANEPRRYPLFRVSLGGDVLCIGFDIIRADAAGYFFGIEEQITEPRFAPPPTSAGRYLRLAELSSETSVHAGKVAAAILRRPVRVMIDPRLLNLNA